MPSIRLAEQLARWQRHWPIDTLLWAAAGSDLLLNLPAQILFACVFSVVFWLMMNFFSLTGDWMSIPSGIPNCPRGLEYLTSIDQLLVKQKVELLEAFTGFETNNKFSIKNSLGQKVYYAVEDNDCCTRNCCGPARPFDMKVFDNYQQEVIHLYRPLACSACCFPCCLQTMDVSAPPGNTIGSIEQEWSICSPSFRIKNHIGDTVLRIEGPFCTFSLCGDVEFNVSCEIIYILYELLINVVPCRLSLSPAKRWAKSPSNGPALHVKSSPMPTSLALRSHWIWMCAWRRCCWAPRSSL